MRAKVGLAVSMEDTAILKEMMAQRSLRIEACKLESILNPLNWGFSPPRTNEVSRWEVITAAITTFLHQINCTYH